VDDADLNKLRVAASLLHQYGTVNAFQEFSGAIDKVVQLINFRKLQSGGNKMDFIEFGKNPPVKGMEFIDQLIPAIRRKHRLSKSVTAPSGGMKSVSLPCILIT
jgi:hypothetical protein